MGSATLCQLPRTITPLAGRRTAGSNSLYRASQSAPRSTSRQETCVNQRLSSCHSAIPTRIALSLLGSRLPAEVSAAMVNSAQTPQRCGITNVTASERFGATALRAARRPRRNMKTSTKDKLKGSFHEVKGSIKEQVGKATNDRDMKAEGKAEKNVGKVQQRVGDAKEAVVKLKGKLAELTTK